MIEVFLLVKRKKYVDTRQKVRVQTLHVYVLSKASILCGQRHQIIPQVPLGPLTPWLPKATNLSFLSLLHGQRVSS